MNNCLQNNNSGAENGLRYNSETIESMKEAEGLSKNLDEKKYKDVQKALDELKNWID